MRAAGFASLALWATAVLLASKVGGQQLNMSGSESDELRSRSGGSGSPRKEGKRSSASKKTRAAGSAPLPSEEPPWLSAVLKQSNTDTVKSIEKKLGKRFDKVDNKLAHICERQEATEEKLAQVASKQDKFEKQQTELREELRQLKAKQLVDQARSSSSFGGASSNASTAAGGAAPAPMADRFPQFAAAHLKPPTDKAEFLVGGWQQSLKQVVESDCKRLVAQIPNTGKIQSLRIPVFNNRANICFIRFEATAEQTSLQLAWIFKKGLDALNPKPTSTGAGKPFWAKPNVPPEERPAARMINRAKKFLHSVREEAGLPISIEEYGHATPWMEANYRVGYQQITVSSIQVATFDIDDAATAADGHTSWNEIAMTNAFGMRIPGWDFPVFVEKWRAFVAASSSAET